MAGPAAAPTTRATPPPPTTGSGQNQDVQAAIKALTDQLLPVKTATQRLIDERYAAYSRVAQQRFDEYDAKAKREAALWEAGFQIVLSLPFFYAADFVGKAVSTAIVNAAPMIASTVKLEASVISEAMKKMLVPTAAAKTVEEAFKEARKGLSKDCAAMCSVNGTMANYAKAFAKSLPDVGDALSKKVGDLDFAGIASIYSAMTLRTKDVFEGEFNQLLKKYETQVAPTFAVPNVIVNPDTGGSSSTQPKLAQVNVGGQTYEVQVMEVITRGEMFVSEKPNYQFICWVDQDADIPRGKPGDIISLTADQVMKLPPGQPPDTSKVA